MATTKTTTGATVLGNTRFVWGTFTTDDLDTIITIATGLSALFAYIITLDVGAIGVETPKVSVSGGTVTGLVTDTRGYSGRWWAHGA